MFKHACAAVAVAVLAAGALAPAAAAPPPPAAAAVPMKKDGGVYVVPVSVNGLVTVDCIVDSGASDVNIPEDVFRKLVRAGTIRRDDFLGTEDYTLADGSTEHGRTYRLRSLKVGGIVVRDVTASVGGDGSSALLGQSFLERFGSWSVDNNRHALVLLGTPRGPAPASRVAAGPKPADGPPSVANSGGDHPATRAPRSDDDGGAMVAQVPSGPREDPGEAGDSSVDDHLTSQQASHSDDDDR